jgi:hypothetical protein
MHKLETWNSQFRSSIYKVSQCVPSQTQENARGPLLVLYGGDGGEYAERTSAVSYPQIEA